MVREDNIWGTKEATINPISHNMTINLNILDLLTKCKIVHDEDGNLVVIEHDHRTLTLTRSISKEVCVRALYSISMLNKETTYFL